MTETREKPRRRLWRGWPIVGFVASLVVVLTAALTAPLVARSVIEARARDRGLEATVGDVRVSLGSVRVSSFEARVARLPGAHVSLEEMVVSLSWFRPREVVAQRGAVTVKGEWTDLVEALSSLSTPEADGRTTPTRVEDMSLTWSLPSGRQAVVVTGARLQRTADQKTLLAASGLDAFGWKLGAFAVELMGKDEPVRVGLGAMDLATAPIRGEAAPLADPTRAEATLRETEAPLLVQLLQLQGLSPPKAKVQGTVALTRQGQVWTGTAEGALRGWAPPVPKELSGIVFGKDTTASASIRADLAKQTGSLDKATVSLGALKLVGNLGFDWTERGPGKLKGALGGSIACSALAGSALGAHLGPLAGGLAGAIAGAAVQGTVGLTLRVDVDLARPSLGKVAPEVAFGCKSPI